MREHRVREVVVTDWAAWPSAAAALLADHVPPESVRFLTGSDRQLGLPLGETPDPFTARLPDKSERPLLCSQEFRRLAETVACHRDAVRWPLLYGALWRLSHHEHGLLRRHADPLIRRLRMMEQAVRRDLHKMRAFVRFRETVDGTFVAWYQPDHDIVRRNAPFFVRRFGSMRWSILTPDLSAHWDREQLRFGQGVSESGAVNEDGVEALWVAYYASIFNPTRVNVKAMTAEMPMRHWAVLPEAKIIRPLVQAAGARTLNMIETAPSSAAEYIPAEASLDQLAQALHGCRGCELYDAATQAVCGEGPVTARIMLVGEQPGDQEDRDGRPFVGPAGQLLDRALTDAGLDRQALYVTNAVKHFRFEWVGQTRGHKTPRASHIAACRPWIKAELERVRPDTIVCLGATAAQSLLGRTVRVEQERGRWLENVWAPRLLITTHPSALLRMNGSVGFPAAYARFVHELKQVSARRD